MELKKRKPVRLKDYDYSSSGVYFITVCSKDRKPIFSRIVGDGDLDVPKVYLYRYGEIIKKNLDYMNEIYDYIEIDNYVIMPNHIHLLLNIEGSIDGRPLVAPTISRVIKQMKGYVSKQIGYSIWQKSFIDHIIRNEKDYIEHYTYIENNPVKWEMDELHV